MFHLRRSHSHASFCHNHIRLRFVQAVCVCVCSCQVLHAQPSSRSWGGLQFVHSSDSVAKVSNRLFHNQSRVITLVLNLHSNGLINREA